MSTEQWVFAAASAALGLAFVLGVPLPDRRTLSHPAVVGGGVLFLLSLIVRAVFVQPTLVHADVAAPELVDCVLRFPVSCTGRGASYGQYGFWVVGGLARLFGRDLNAVFLAMQIIGALVVALLAVLAHRLSGSPYGGLLVVAATGTNPVFMRVAASEDMHNMGLCMALIGLIAMDAFAVTRRSAALVAAVIALCLMMYTRQTFYLFAPCAFFLGLARGGSALLKSPRFWIAGFVVIAVLLPRVFGVGHVTSQMLPILTDPVLAPTILRFHALLDFSRFGLLPVLTVAAIVWAFVAGGVARAVAIVFAANFVITYPCGMPSPGVELAQRLSTYALGMLIFAMGGAALLEGLVGPKRRVAAGLVGAVVLAVLPPLFPGWGTLSALTPIHREYLAVEAAAAALPPEFTQIVLPTTDSTSYGGSRYAGLLARTGKKANTVMVDEVEGMPHPWVFLENIECWTYSFYEVIGIEKQVAKQQRAFEYRWDLVLFGRQPSPLRPPGSARPQCEPFLRSGTPIGPTITITDAEDDPPFLFYASRAVPIRFLEIRDLPRGEAEAGG